MGETTKLFEKILKEVEELYDFIERLEATTKDKDTAQQIRELLEAKGIWD